MEEIGKNRRSLPGTETASEVLDFAALAHSIRPPGAPVEPPSQIVAEEPKVDIRTGVSWIWIAAGLGGITLGALGAVVIESQFRSQSEPEALVVADASGEKRADAPHVSAHVAEAPQKPAAPAFVPVDQPEEQVAKSLAKAQNDKPATVVSSSAMLSGSVSEHVASDKDGSQGAQEGVNKGRLRHKSSDGNADEAANFDSESSPEQAEAADEDEIKAHDDVEAKPEVELPVRPSRSEVARLLGGARPEIEACAEGRHGTVEVTLNVGSSGRVKSALVDGTFRGSPEGSCMARVARSLRFPAFEDDSFQVEYPYRF